MTLNIKTRLHYNFAYETEILMQIEAAATFEQVIKRATVHVEDPQYFVRVSSHDYVGERIWVKKQGDFIADYDAELYINRQATEIAGLPSTSPSDLPGSLIQYLFDSTYCPALSFQNFVHDEFGNLAGGDKIIAINNWIKNNVIYQSGASNVKTTALDTFVERRGVCRDFAHLLISLSRAALIPARFASVYAPNVTPQDFHAIAEVYLDGQWYLIDPTEMADPKETAIIGVGRDAVDVAFITSYGYGSLLEKSIEVESV